MKRIFKYPVPVTASLCIDLPKGATVLTVQTQRGQPQIWAIVDDAEPSERRLFYWFGTGHALPEPLGAYVGSVQLDGETQIFHLFERAVT